jgi:hypothetical protein
MKKLSFWICAGSAVLLTACATCPPLPPVGPSPVSSGPTEPGTGTLVVYSAWSCFDTYLTSDHSGYTIYSQDGKRIKYVPNCIEGDWTVEPPTRVSLPPGFYRIKAAGGVYGWVNVPVVVKSGETTPVYLDGERHSIDSLASQNDLVRLPDGQVVGWAANPLTN